MSARRLLIWFILTREFYVRHRTRDSLVHHHIYWSIILLPFAKYMFGHTRKRPRLDLFRRVRISKWNSSINHFVVISKTMKSRCERDGDNGGKYGWISIIRGLRVSSAIEQAWRALEDALVPFMHVRFVE